MERVRYRDEKCELLVYIDSELISGFKICNQEIYPITREDLEVFSVLRNVNLPSFFYQKGLPTTVYQGGGAHLGKERKLTFGQKIIIGTFIGLSLIAGAYATPIIAETGQFIGFLEDSRDYELQDILQAIQSSTYLNQEEKDFLKNIDLLEDIIPTINTSLSTKALFRTYLRNMMIRSYGPEDPKYNSTFGYYSTDYPSSMFVKNYENLSDHTDTVAHEYIHLLQDTSGYNMIIESCAEIISTEYFHTPESNYYFQVKLTKMLMETIGSDVVWTYNFTGDFSGIEERVKPNLTEEQYQEFLDCLTFDYDDASLNFPKFDRLEELIGILYQKIYHKDISEDLIIQLVRNHDLTLSRYYFNPRFINPENSYYLDYNLGEYESLSYEDAFNSGLIMAFATQKTPISMDEAMEIVKSRNYAIHREIDYQEHTASVLRTTTNGVQMFMTVVIDGIRYDDIDVDELARQGIIHVDYYLVKQKRLTYEEYRDHDYWEDAEITMMHAGDTELQEDVVVGFVPRMMILPTIDTRYQESIQK